jgi:aldose 1-epimerase
VLRGASPEAMRSASVYGFAGFPLLPYSGPIFGDGFEFAGTWHPLGRTVREEPTATHGEGWIRPWSIVAQEPQRLDLRLDHPPMPGTFPFAWRGRLVFTLTADGLAVDIALTNRDHRPMPGGIGYHPYFPRPEGTVLRFDATGMWPPDAPENVLLGCGPMDPALDFASGVDVSAIVLDRCFEGWDGVATLEWPDGAAARLSAGGALTRLQIYAPCDYPYVCVEPVSNANDGFNRMAKDVPCHGVAVLEPGRTLSGHFTLSFVTG